MPDQSTAAGEPAAGPGAAWQHEPTAGRRWRVPLAELRRERHHPAHALHLYTAMNRLLTTGIRLVLPLLAASCDRARDTRPVAASVEAAADAPAEPEIFRPDAERTPLPRGRIYYTLTDYAWYAHGEPLMHDGRAYQPSGQPLAASIEDMSLVGEYEGVEYYLRRADPVPTLYVPVFEGYWLPFSTDTTARANAAEPPAS